MSSIHGAFSRMVGLEASEVADGIVVFDPSHDQVHYLNSTAAVVFELCDGTRTVHDIADSAATLFPDSVQNWEQLVIDCLADLLRQHLIESGHSATTADHRHTN